MPPKMGGKIEIAAKNQKRTKKRVNSIFPPIFGGMFMFHVLHSAKIAKAKIFRATLDPMILLKRRGWRRVQYDSTHTFSNFPLSGEIFPHFKEVLEVRTLHKQVCGKVVANCVTLPTQAKFV